MPMVQLSAFPRMTLPDSTMLLPPCKVTKRLRAYVQAAVEVQLNVGANCTQASLHTSAIPVLACQHQQAGLSTAQASQGFQPLLPWGAASALGTLSMFSNLACS